jgi:hypothetical protein
MDDNVSQVMNRVLDPSVSFSAKTVNPSAYESVDSAKLLITHEVCDHVSICAVIGFRWYFSILITGITHTSHNE